MSADLSGDDRRQPRYEFDRHTPEYRHQFEAITQEMQANCPLAWSDTHGGNWVAAGNREVFELARAAGYLSNDHDVHGERRGYQGITIPTPAEMQIQGGFLEMDPPEQREYRQALNPYLSPAAVARWAAGRGGTGPGLPASRPTPACTRRRTHRPWPGCGTRR